MQTRPHLRVVFISHLFSDDPEKNGQRVVGIVRQLTEEGHLALAPQIYLPQFIDEKTERPLALRICLELVGLADEVRVYGELSEGMRLEIAEAERLGIPVVYEDPNVGEMSAEKRPGGPGRKVVQVATSGWPSPVRSVHRRLSCRRWPPRGLLPGRTVWPSQTRPPCESGHAGRP